MTFLQTSNYPNIKTLFLGNNDDSTDQHVTELAKEHETINHGLIKDPTIVPAQSGYYHTTIVDIPWGDLIKLANQFDSIVMLDQPQAQWSHWKCFQATFKLMVKLEELHKHTVFRNNNNVKKILYWSDLVYNKNKSFCIYPWINFSNNGKELTLCSRDRGSVTATDKFQNWKTDANYIQIRNKMLQGEQLPEHCGVCYEYENSGMESYRQFETMDWVTQLDLENVDDLDQLNRPYFYEMHIGNHCNIKCRGCAPASSAPIGRELKKFNIVAPTQLQWEPGTGSIDQIDIDSLDKKSSVYFQGGEPTIMPEVREFMKRCLAKNKTDFFLTMCTNGVKLSTEFLQLISNFPNTNFSISLDGYSKINDYWRSGTDWNKVIQNLHLLFDFLDREFPFTAMYLQVNYLSWQSALNHPLKDLVLKSMQKCMQTSVYHSNGKSCKSGIDSIYNHYANNPVCNIDSLRDFFAYNDQLDQVRGTKLIDFIPELEAARKYINE